MSKLKQKIIIAIKEQHSRTEETPATCSSNGQTPLPTRPSFKRNISNKLHPHQRSPTAQAQRLPKPRQISKNKQQLFFHPWSLKNTIHQNLYCPTHNNVQSLSEQAQTIEGWETRPHENADSSLKQDTYGPFVNQDNQCEYLLGTLQDAEQEEDESNWGQLSPSKLDKEIWTSHAGRSNNKIKVKSQESVNQICDYYPSGNPLNLLRTLSNKLETYEALEKKRKKKQTEGSRDESPTAKLARSNESHVQFVAAQGKQQKSTNNNNNNYNKGEEEEVEDNNNNNGASPKISKPTNIKDDSLRADRHTTTSSSGSSSIFLKYREIVKLYKQEASRELLACQPVQKDSVPKKTNQQTPDVRAQLQTSREETAPQSPIQNYGGWATSHPSYHRKHMKNRFSGGQIVMEKPSDQEYSLVKEVGEPECKKNGSECRTANGQHRLHTYLKSIIINCDKTIKKEEEKSKQEAVSNDNQEKANSFSSHNNNNNNNNKSDDMSLQKSKNNKKSEKNLTKNMVFTRDNTVLLSKTTSSSKATTTCTDYKLGVVQFFKSSNYEEHKGKKFAGLDRSKRPEETLKLVRLKELKERKLRQKRTLLQLLMGTRLKDVTNQKCKDDENELAAAASDKQVTLQSKTRSRKQATEGDSNSSVTPRSQFPTLVVGPGLGQFADSKVGVLGQSGNTKQLLLLDKKSLVLTQREVTKGASLCCTSAQDTNLKKNHTVNYLPKNNTISGLLQKSSSKEIKVKLTSVSPWASLIHTKKTSSNKTTSLISRHQKSKFNKDNNNGSSRNNVVIVSSAPTVHEQTDNKNEKEPESRQISPNSISALQTKFKLTQQQLMAEKMSTSAKNSVYASQNKAIMGKSQRMMGLVKRSGSSEFVGSSSEFEDDRLFRYR